MNADRELWRWTIRLWEPQPGPNGKVADSLDEAKAAFRAAGEAHACGAFDRAPGEAQRTLTIG